MIEIIYIYIYIIYYWTWQESTQRQVIIFGNVVLIRYALGQIIDWHIICMCTTVYTCLLLRIYWDKDWLRKIGCETGYIWNSGLVMLYKLYILFLWLTGLEHRISSTKVVGSIPREHTYCQKMYSLNWCTSLPLSSVLFFWMLIPDWLLYIPVRFIMVQIINFFLKRVNLQLLPTT